MTNIAYNGIICRYGEIALKGHNRGQFERLFVKALKRALAEWKKLCCARERGRVLIHLNNFRPFPAELVELVRRRLVDVFGLESFSVGCIVDSDMAAIEPVVTDVFEACYNAFTAETNGAEIRYRMRSRRSDKTFPMTTREIEIHFADTFIARYPGLKVDLDDADVTIGVEIRRSWTCVFSEKISGPGGLPAGCSSPALALLSGGIDSPVACYQTMKRGCHLNFLTFHSHPYTPPDTILKVARLVRRLNQFQRPGRLLSCNLLAAQKVIRDSCAERYRTILYRRLMFRIATVIAAELGDRALVTGEAIGQVASQTIKNLDLINRASDLLVIRPLVSYDKQETMAIARRIGTLETSEIQCPDSCTVFAPTSPSTGATIAAIEREESALDIPGQVAQCLEAVTSVDLKTGEQREWVVRRSIGSRSDLCDAGCGMPDAR